jgi:hypothetical protein
MMRRRAVCRTWIDYLQWRGDLTYELDAFNVVDNLVFACLAYTDYKGVVPDAGAVTLAMRRGF